MMQRFSLTLINPADLNTVGGAASWDLFIPGNESQRRRSCEED